MATKAEKEEAAKAAEEAELNASQKDPADLPDKTPEELKADSDRIEADRLKREEEKRKAREASAETPNSDRMYSRMEVEALIKKVLADNKKREDSGQDLIDEEDINKNKRARLPRFQNKFILGFVNTNTDQYFPDAVIHAFDVWNNEQKRNEAWVKVKFEGEAEPMNLPLYTVISRSQKVWVDVVEVMATDTSYSTGKVERAEVKDYSKSGTGQYVSARVTQAKYTYKLRLPEGDGFPEREVIVGPEVINW